MIDSCLRYQTETKELVLIDLNANVEALEQAIDMLSEDVVQKIEQCIFSNAVFLQALPNNLGQFPLLKRLSISHCNSLQNLENIQKLAIENLDASRCIKLKDVSQIEHLHQLRSLDLSYDLSLESLEVLPLLTETLCELNLEGLVKLQSTRHLIALKNLKQLNIRYTSIKNLDELGFIPKILWI